MHQFMIDITLPAVLTKEFIALVPQQRVQVGRLLNERRLTSFSLAQDRSKCWATMLAESEAEVREILASFPLREFMKVKIHQLQFVENAPALVAHISLN